MTDDRTSNATVVSDDNGTGRGRKQAQGHEFALNALAETRYQSKTLLQRLNATDSVSQNAIFLPRGFGKRNSHANAHAAVLTYRDELVKPSYLQRANVDSFLTETFTEARIPKDLADGLTVNVTVTDPRNDVDPASADIPMTNWPITLENLGWWSMRFITIRKEIDSPYWEEDSQEEQRKVVLPPRVLRAAFNRLDALAAELGVLLQVKKNSPHDST